MKLDEFIKIIIELWYKNLKRMVQLSHLIYHFVEMIQVLCNWKEL